MRIFFLGAANPETIKMAAAVSRSQPNFSIGGFIDNDPDKKGKDFYGHRIFGGIDVIPSLLGEDVRFVNLITGNTRTRYETTAQILAAGGTLGNFIHPNVDLTMVGIGTGLYIQEQVCLQAEVEVGDNSSIHIGAMIGHETKIGSSVFIAHAVSISGCCTIGDGTFIGTNATVLPRLKIGKWCTIGAGSVVTKDVPDYSVVVGNPGKVLRTIEPF